MTKSMPEDAPRAGYGPLPAETTLTGPALSGSRRAVLDMLRNSTAPMTLADLRGSMSLHANTLREHVQALEASGDVRRFGSAPMGRGRPAWLYEAVRPQGLPGRGDYAGLAAVLAAVVRRRSRRPRQVAVEAGTTWGEGLASGRTAAGGRGRAGIRRAVIDLLAELGFAPEPNRSATSVRLTRCPLLEAARLQPDVVCAVHEGIVRGALHHWGDTTTEVTLAAFAEPGACRLRLGQSPAGAQGPS